ncbi:mechanosensitive ion channel family protein [Marinobacter sp.]|uniref:mechanosensitive ion channel family protein n=1 Tax=Marinobacter sp. TaxID=50741 RepID=UPI001B547CB8|nr:mechanosensitive ion channel family protein [Marinobacter sp.]MBQ0832321.1 mechanosensitive ion channel family protein [Marinobacter sp.]
MPADTDTVAITDDQTSEIETYLTDIAQGVSQLLPESAQSSWQLILQHPILGALLIALASYIIAISFRSLLANLVGRMTGLTRPSVDDAVMKDLRKPIFNTIFFLGASLAIVVANLPLGGITLIKIFLSIITASWMGAVIKISTLALQALSRENRFQLIDARTVPLLDLTSKLLSIMIGSYVLLIIWGVNPAGWLASAGIVGLALGFAAKDTLGNLFSGFFIVADAPYKIGDYINLDSGERGKVCAIGLRSTRLLTRDDVEITIPNGVIANAKIINESGGPLSLRIRIIVGVAYGSDADQVVQLLLKAGTEHNEVCKLPEPRVRLRGFGTSSLDFNLMCWITKPEDRGRIAHELHMAIYKLFNEHGVEIPYAKRDLYIKQWPKDNSQE